LAARRFRAHAVDAENEKIGKNRSATQKKLAIPIAVW
jgi:hypothetical protein